MDGSRDYSNGQQARWYPEDDEEYGERRRARETRYDPLAGDRSYTGEGERYADDAEGRYTEGGAGRGYGDSTNGSGHLLGRDDLSGRYAEGGDPSRSGAVGARSGLDLPPLPGEEGPQPAADFDWTRPSGLPSVPAPSEPVSPGRSSAIAPTTPARGGLYRTRRAGVAVLLAGIAVVAELFFVRILLTGEFRHTINAGWVLAGVFAMSGVPLATAGLYGLVTGATATAPTPGRAWLKPPLAYLPVGLTLLIAAALAA